MGTILDKNRVFLMDALQELMESGMNLLTYAMNISETIESEINTLIAIGSRIPGEAVNSSFMDKTSTLQGQLRKPEFQECYDELKNILSKVIENIPKTDTKMSKAVEAITEVTLIIDQRITDLRNVIGDPGMTGDYVTFLSILEQYKVTWEKTNAELDAQFNIVKAMLKGLEQISCEYSVDPVNLATGNFVYDHIDITIGGAFPLILKRIYNSQDDATGSFGRKWTYNFYTKLTKNSDNNSITVLFEDSHEEIFHKNEENSYISLRSDQSSLFFWDGKYILTTAEYKRYLFLETGECIEAMDSHANLTQYFYTDSHLTRIANKCGEIKLEYQENGFISRALDQYGRMVRYTYDKDMLVKMEDETGASVSYEYDRNGNITAVTNHQGICQVRNRFDEKGRTTSQVFPDGGKMTYIYNDKEHAVVLTEQNGNQITYIHDEQYHNTKIIHGDGEEIILYDEKGNKAAYVDKNGNKTQYEYTKDGDLHKVTDHFGYETKIEYNSQRKPVCLYQKDGTRKYNYYNKKGNLIKSIDPIGRKIGYHYSNYARPYEIILPDLSNYKFTFDKRENITSITDPLGNTIQYEYDSLNHIQKTIDAKGNESQFEYDRNGRITKVTNSFGNTRHYQYNKSGLLIEFHDFDDSCYQMNYNSLNKLQEFIDPYGARTSYEYDKMWNVAAVTCANGAKTEYQYNQSNKLSQVIRADGGKTRYQYDPKGNVIKVSLPNESVMHYEYDALAHITAQTDASGEKTCKEYDKMGRLTRIYDTNGRELNMLYDDAGQLVQKTDYMGNSITMTYTLLGKLETVTDINGNVTYYEYYPGGKLRKLTKPNGQSTFYEYDENGNVKSKTSESGFKVIYHYDSLNRLTEITDTYLRRRRFEYDAVNNVTARIDENGNRTSYTYQPMNRLTNVTDPIGNRTNYEYDCMGWLSSISYDLDGENANYSDSYEEARELNQQSVCYERNAFGKITTITDAMGRKEHFQYDCMGNVVNHTDKNGNVMAYQYNEWNKVNQIAYADGKCVEYQYNELKQLDKINDWLGKTTFSYDAHGFIESITDHNDKTVDYQYNHLGQRTSLKIAGENEIIYSYDHLNRLTGLKKDALNVEYHYNDLGRLKEKVFQNGVRTEYSFNAIGQITELKNYDTEGVLDHFRYEYDLAGNKTSVWKFRRDLEEDSGTFRYEYDPLNRLIGIEKEQEHLRRYTYDGLGNRTKMLEGNNWTEYAYNELRQLIITCEDGQKKEYNYDFCGNLSNILTNGEISDTFSYDLAGHLIHANEKEFIYNGLGYKVGDSDGTYLIDYTKNYHNILRKDSASYLWDMSIVGDGNSLLLQDELGTPIRKVGVDGGVQDSYRYDEFGNRKQGRGRFTYTGYEEVAGMHFAQARFYEPSLGRFLSRDKIKGHSLRPFTMNEYTYAYNNPLKYVDLDGNYPSLGDIGDALGDAGKWVADGVCDAGEFVVDGVTTGAGYIADGVSTGVQFIADGVSTGVGYVADGIAIGADYIHDGASAGLQFIKINIVDSAISGINGIQCYLSSHTLCEILTDFDELTNGVFKSTVYNLVTSLARLQLPEKIEATYNDTLPAPLRYILDKAWSGYIAVANWALDRAVSDQVENFGVNVLLYPIAGYALGFQYDPVNDVYYTTDGSIQQQFGFGDAFDELGPLLGMDLEEEPIVFTYNGKEYLLEPWMGKYGYGFNTGGEIGIYCRPEKEATENPYVDKDEPDYVPGINDDVFYQSAAGDDQLKMQFVLINGATGEVVEESSSKEDRYDYWALSITSFDNTEKDDLVMKGTIESEDELYLEAIKVALIEEGIKVELDDGILYFSWNPNKIDISEISLNSIKNRED